MIKRQSHVPIPPETPACGFPPRSPHAILAGVRMNLLIRAALFLAAACPQTTSPPDAHDPAWQRGLESWRAQRAADLQAPEGWLSLVGLAWLTEGDNTFGSAADNQIRVAGGSAPHLGVLRLEGRNVRLLPPGGGFPPDFLVDGKSADAQSLRTDEDKPPSKLTAGTLIMLLIHRGDRIALRIKDSQAPTRVNFHGLRWYAPNVAYRARAHWIPYHPPKSITVSTIVNTTENYPAPGAAEFSLAGKTYRLEPVLEEPDANQLFFILRDTTSRTTTYPAVRFLYTQFPDHGLTHPGNLWLDFNRLQNPPCAYTAYATCPLPPPQNRLPVAIPAGEKRYHD